MYDAAAWHDYFMTVGGGAAALTGLVFVAMSLHLDQIALNPAHRHRARTVLTGLTAVFIRCALVLMAKQSGQAVALELIVVLIAVELVLYRSIRQALAATDASDPALLWRTIGSFSCLVIEQAGALALFFGNAGGLYVVGVGMMSSFVFMVTGAWLLIVGVRREEAAEATA
jgi:modulator of FtsH protease